MTNTNKPNDFIAASINGANENLSLDDLRYYNITPDNTGIQSKDYYKNIPKVKELFIKDGKFDEEKYNAWYNDTLDIYNTWANDDFENKMIDAMERSSYNIFELGNNNIADDTAKIISAKDPERTARGLTDPFSINGPSFDIREVAQANKVLDENGNELDWSPNDKGGIFKAITRPAMAIAQWEDDGWHIENGVKVEHHKGDMRLGSNGDPQYQILGNKSAVGREMLHYTDTFTRDDEWLNKFDFFDNDGLTKSVGGTIARTAFMLAPMFIPGVNTVVGWGGAALALAQTMPVLLRAINGFATGDNDNAFGRQMNEIENYFRRFDTTVSRKGQQSFFSLENLGEMVSSSAAQLFQQRNIINAAGKWIKFADATKNRKLGSAISLGYMAATSSGDTYEIFKQAGMSDWMASLGVLAVTSGIYGMMSSGYIFKDAMFKNTWLAEDQERRQMLKTLADYGNAQFTKAQRKIVGDVAKGASTFTKEEIAANAKWFNKLKNKTIEFFTKGDKAYKEGLMKAESIANVEMAKTPFWQEVLGRGLNEGIEEVMEESATDTYKLFSKGLEALGINVTDKDSDLDFKETWADVLGRYATAFIGGTVGGMTFAGFSEWDRLARNKFKPQNIDRNLITNLVAAITNPDAKSELYRQLNIMEKKGQVGNKNLSAKISTIYDDGDPLKITNVIYGEGTDEDNQNKANASFIRYLLGNIETSINDNEIKSYDVVATSITANLMKKAQEMNMDYEEYLKSQNINPAIFIMQQKGALDGVYSEMLDKSVDIVTKDLDIRTRRKEILAAHGDTGHAEAEEQIKKDQTIKQLTKERDQLKEEYAELESGARADFYASILNFASDGSKLTAYMSDDKLIKKNKNALPLINAENYTYLKYGVKLDDPNLSDAYKESKRKEWENYKNNELPRKIWSAHQIHYNLSEQLTPKIMAADTALKGFKSDGTIIEKLTRSYDAMLQQINYMLETTEATDTERIATLTKVKSDITAEKAKLNEVTTKIEELSRTVSKDAQQALKTLYEGINTAYENLIGTFLENASMKDVVAYHRNYFQSLHDAKIITDTDYELLAGSADQFAEGLHAVNYFTDPHKYNLTCVDDVYNELNGGIFRVEEISKNSVEYAIRRTLNAATETGKPEGFAKLALEFLYKLGIDKTHPTSDLNEKFNDPDYRTVFGDLINQLSQDKSTLEGFDFTDVDSIDELTGDYAFAQGVVKYFPGLNIAEAKEAFDSANNFLTENPLLTTRSIQTELITAMKSLEQAFKNRNYDKVRDNYAKINEIIGTKLSDPFTQDYFKSWLFVQVNPDGSMVRRIESDDIDDFLKIADSNNGLFSKLGKNPIWDLLAQIDTFTGGRYAPAINRVRSEIERFNALGANAEQAYVINEIDITKELESVKDLLNIAEAILGSAVDGSNAQLNQYRSLTGKFEFAIIQDNTRAILAQGDQFIRDKIDYLLDISKRNAMRQLSLQKDTFIKSYPKIALKVKEILNTHSDKNPDTWNIPVDELWREHCGDLNPEIINADNFDEYKKNIDEFYEAVREAVKSRAEEQGKRIVDFLLDKLKVYNTLYFGIQTELSPDVENISDWTGFQQLTINLLASPKEVDSIYNYARKQSEFSGIIPFMAQELILKNAFVYANHKDEIEEILTEIYNQEQTYTNDDKQEETYIKSRQFLPNVIHIDGTAGAGKTELTRLLEEMFKTQKKGTKVSQVYSAIFQDHIDRNMKPRLGDGYKYINVGEVLAKTMGDYYKHSDAHKLYKDKNLGELTNEAWAVIDKNIEDNWEDINPFTGLSEDTIKVWVIDEDGFINPYYWQVLSKIAKKSNAIIVGTGDSTQNGAYIGGIQKTLEDCIVWNTPFLTVSMRAQNRGKLLNQTTLYSLINKIAKKFDNPIIEDQPEYNKETQSLLDANSTNIIGYSTDTDVFGEFAVDTDEAALEQAKKLKARIKELNDAETEESKKTHSIIIVTDNPTKWNIPELKNDNIIILSKESVQGGQADYVIIDRSDWSDRPYSALKDFYTMTSRSKIGTVIVNKPNSSNRKISDILNLNFTLEETAQIVQDPEKKKQELEGYKTWREGIFDKTTSNWDLETDYLGKADEKSSTSSPTLTSSSSGSSSSSLGTPPPIPSISGSSTSPEEKGKLPTKSIPTFGNEEDFIEHSKEIREKNISDKKAESPTIGDFDSFVEFLRTDETITTKCAKDFDKTKNWRKGLILFSKIIVQGKALNITEVDRDVQLKLNKYGIPDAFVSDFVDSLTHHSGYFYITKTDDKNIRTIYYLFRDRLNNPQFIPVFQYSDESSDGNKEQVLEYDKLNFKEVEGTGVLVSTNGSIRKKLTDVFPDMESEDLQLAILNGGVFEETSPLMQNEIDPSSKDNILGFVADNSGKAFVVIPKYSGLSRNAIISPSRNASNKINYLMRRHGKIPIARLVGTQEIISLTDFIAIAKAKNKIVGAQNNTDIEDAVKIIRTYFGNDAVAQLSGLITKLGETGSSAANENRAKIYEALRPYEAIHWTSVGKLISAVLRYFDSSDSGSEAQKKIWEELFKRFNSTDKFGSINKYKSAASFNIMINNSVVSVSIESVGSGKYRLWVSKGTGVQQGCDISGIDIGDGKSLFNLKDYVDAVSSGNINYTQDFIVKLYNFLKDNGNTDVQNLLKIISKDGSEDVVREAFKNGRVFLGLTKLRYSNRGSNSTSPDAIYQAFDNELGSIFEKIDDVTLSKLDEWLKHDSIFKYQLYANIHGKFESNSDNIWLPAAYNNDYMSSDIIKAWLPAYTLSIGEDSTNKWARNAIDYFNNPENNVKFKFKKEGTEIKISDAEGNTLVITMDKAQVENNCEELKTLDGNAPSDIKDSTKFTFDHITKEADGYYIYLMYNKRNPKWVKAKLKSDGEIMHDLTIFEKPSKAAFKPEDFGLQVVGDYIVHKESGKAIIGYFVDDDNNELNLYFKSDSGIYSFVYSDINEIQQVMEFLSKKGYDRETAPLSEEDPNYGIDLDGNIVYTEEGIKYEPITDWNYSNGIITINPGRPDEKKIEVLEDMKKMLEIPESKPTDTKLAEEPKIDINFIIKDYISKNFPIPANMELIITNVNPVEGTFSGIIQDSGLLQDSEKNIEINGTYSKNPADGTYRIIFDQGNQLKIMQKFSEWVNSVDLNTVPEDLKPMYELLQKNVPTKSLVFNIKQRLTNKDLRKKLPVNSELKEALNVLSKKLIQYTQDLENCKI